MATQGGGFAAFAAPSAAGKLAHLLLGEYLDTQTRTSRSVRLQA